MATRGPQSVAERGPVAFLATRAEALAFWASIVGLALVVVVTAAQLAGHRTAADLPPAAVQRIEALEAREADQAAEIDRLRAGLRAVQTRLDSLENR